MMTEWKDICFNFVPYRDTVCNTKDIVIEGLTCWTCNIMIALNYWKTKLLSSFEQGCSTKWTVILIKIL